VHKISGVVFRQQLNIISNGEYVDKASSHFFMRTEFSGAFNRAQLERELDAILPAHSIVYLRAQVKQNIVILATREHHCLSDLLIRCTYHELSAHIGAVISNYDTLSDLVSKFNIPFHFISHEGKERDEHEAELLSVIKSYGPAYLVLAKYMRILSSDFVSHYPNRIINIHHSFLPAFIGANPYQQAYDRGVKIIGATAHFVNNSLDEGPILSQSVIPVDHSHSAREMAQAGKDVEKMVLSRSLKLVLEDRVFVHNNKTIIFD
jgi:formyltetrahydrofolate deformylase